MSHAVYHTEAFVIGQNERGEGSRTIYLFTKEFGLLGAVAQSVRETRSKLRYHLQVYDHAEVSLVRGKEVWRVTGAQAGKLSKKIFEDREKRAMVARIFSLVKRLVPREEREDKIYDDIFQAINYLDRDNVARQELDGLEILIVLRILRALGYLREEEKFSPLVSAQSWDMGLLSLAYDSRLFAISAINNSLRESQL
jgi:DNA repair protein RecO